jgi:hypothetical protein
LEHLRLTPCLTPHGHLALVPASSDEVPELEAVLAERLREAFARGSGHGLVQLGAGEVGRALPPIFSYWREFGARYVTAVCTRPEGEEHAALPPPSEDVLERLASAAPPMPGAEYLSAAVLRALWDETARAFAAGLAASRAGLQGFLKKLHPAWNVVGRVHFHLAENRKDPEAPFAFLATYTSRLSAHGKAQHLPLGQALKEFSGAANREQLLSLLLPVQRAAERCAWLRQMVDQGEVFHPLRWTAGEALSFLRDLLGARDVGRRIDPYPVPCSSYHGFTTRIVSLVTRLRLRSDCSHENRWRKPMRRRPYDVRPIGRRADGGSWVRRG